MSFLLHLIIDNDIDDDGCDKLFYPSQFVEKTRALFGLLTARPVPVITSAHAISISVSSFFHFYYSTFVTTTAELRPLQSSKQQFLELASYWMYAFTL